VRSKGRVFSLAAADHVIAQDLDEALVVTRLRQFVHIRKLTDLDNLQQGIDVQLHVNGKQVLRVVEGAKLSIEVLVSKPSFVTLLDIDADGNVAVLHPNQFQQNQLVLPTKPLELPASSFELVARKPFGRGIVKALVTSSPLRLPVLDRVQGRLADIGSISELVTELLTQFEMTQVKSRGLVVTGRTLPVDGWGAATAYVEIVRI
jgi:hypothetical protein